MFRAIDFFVQELAWLTYREILLTRKRKLRSFISSSAHCEGLTAEGKLTFGWYTHLFDEILVAHVSNARVDGAVTTTFECLFLELGR